MRGLSHLANVDPTQAKAVLDSVNQKQVLVFNLIYAEWSTENLLVPLLSLIKRDEISVKDIVEIVKMMQPPPDKPTAISEVAALMKILDSS